jgi:hypothetical protein
MPFLSVPAIIFEPLAAKVVTIALFSEVWFQVIPLFVDLNTPKPVLELPYNAAEEA